MSLYDDLLTDFPIPKPEINTTNTSSTNSTNSNDIANWNNSNLKLLQIQVETAKKRQSSVLAAQNRSVKQTTSIAPVIDLSRDKRAPQLQLRKDDTTFLNTSGNGSTSATTTVTSAPLNQMPPTLALTTSSHHHHHSANELRFNTLTGKLERNDTQSIYGSSNEEYDPMRPNDYEKLLNELKRTNKQVGKDSPVKSVSLNRKSDEHNRKSSSHDRHRSRSRSRRRRRRHSKSSSSRSSSSRSYSSRSRSSSRSSSSRSRNSKKNKSKRHSSSSEDDRRKRNKSDGRDSHGDSANKRAAIAPPTSLLEDTSKQVEANKTQEKPVAQSKPFAGLFKAEKMMAKMGYKEGEGLGRNKQGMSMALQVEKTGRRSGRIIHEKDVAVSEQPPIIPPPPPSIAATTTTPTPVVGIPNEVMKNMSKVILLKNMVAPGDVDDDLEGETKEECQKYGEVNKCIIYEMTDKSPEEAVRIFIEFKTLPSAIKALTDLNGRFFGGRIVKATFYNFDKFNRLELADEE